MRRRIRILAGSALAALWLLHNDLWWWNDGRLVLGMPVGLTFHIGFCVAVSIVLGALVYAESPAKREPPAGREEERR